MSKRLWPCHSNFRLTFSGACLFWGSAGGRAILIGVPSASPSPFLKFSIRRYSVCLYWQGIRGTLVLSERPSGPLKSVLLRRRSQHIFIEILVIFTSTICFVDCWDTLAPWSVFRTPYTAVWISMRTFFRGWLRGSLIATWINVLSKDMSHNTLVINDSLVLCFHGWGSDPRDKLSSTHSNHI